MTDNGVKPYHVTANGNTPAGPERWKRARHNAAKRPNSYGAKLYRKRLDSALCTDYRDAYEGAHVFKDERSERRHYTCSAFCAAMVVQLLIPASDGKRQVIRDILAFANMDGYTDSGWRLYALGEMPVAKIRCFHCGMEFTGIGGPTREVVKLDEYAMVSQEVAAGVQLELADESTVPEEPWTDRYVLLPGGAVVKLDELQLRVVELTDREADLLRNYSTTELRRGYFNEHGHDVKI